MCEFTHRIFDLKQAMSGKFTNDLFPMHVRNKYPYRVVQEGQCLGCRRTLWDKDRRPSGRATRSLCDRCFTDLIANMINYYCFICGQRLPGFKVRAQINKQREISHHIDDGYCLDYFTLVHCKVVGGVDMSFLKDGQPGQIYVQGANYQDAQHRNELEFQTLQNINNLKRLIHHSMVNQPVLPTQVSNRNLLEAPRQPNSREFRSNDVDIDFDSVPVIRLPK